MKHFVILLAVLSLSFSAIDLTEQDAAFPVVLVHGAWESGDIWSELIPLLHSNNVAAPVLLGHGGDKFTDPSTITLADYVAQVERVVQNLTRPVMLVGHSFGGITVSQVAENIPENIRVLVYIAAFLPQDKDSLQTLAGLDTDSELPPFIQFSQFYNNLTAGAENIFLGGCDVNQTLIQATTNDLLMEREPLIPQADRVSLTEKFANLPKFYISTALDKAVSPKFQMWMVDRVGVNQVLTLQSGHLPMICDTQDLANDLNALISAYSSAMVLFPSLISLMVLLSAFLM